MSTLVEKLSNCCNYFLRLSGFLDLSGKVFMITFKLDYSTMFPKRNVSNRVIITVKAVTL